jgi:hypothetical protein
MGIDRRSGRGRRNGQETGTGSKNPWINGQIISASERGGLQMLLVTVAKHLPQMNLINLSTSLHRMAKLTSNDPAALNMVQNHTVLIDLLVRTTAIFEPGAMGMPAQVSDAQPRALSNIAWAVATIRLVDSCGQLMQAIGQAAAMQMRYFKPFELTMLLWAFAKLDVPSNGTLFQAAARHIVDEMQTLDFRCLASSAWSFATAKFYVGDLFRSISIRMMATMNEANCQELANATWAFATVGHRDDPLFVSIAEEAVPKLAEFKAQELSNLLWGFGANSTFHEGLFVAASRAAQQADLRAQHLANILWAYARVGTSRPITQSTVLALLPFCTRTLEHFKPQEASSTAYAVAKVFAKQSDKALPWPVAEFFASVAVFLPTRLPEFSEQSLANLFCAYTMVRYEYLVGAVEEEIECRLDMLEPSGLLCLLKGLTVAPCVTQRAHAMIKVLARRMMESLYEYELRTLTQVCVSVLQLPQNTLSWEEVEMCFRTMAEGSLPHCAERPGAQEAVSAALARGCINNTNGSLHSLTNSCTPWFGKEQIMQDTAALEPLAASWPTAAEQWPTTLPIDMPVGYAAAAYSYAAGADRTPSKPPGNFGTERQAQTPPTERETMEPVSDSDSDNSSPRWKCSVKNTFLHIESGDKEDSDDSEDPLEQRISERVKQNRFKSAPITSLMLGALTKRHTKNPHNQIASGLDAESLWGGKC